MADGPRPVLSYETPTEIPRISPLVVMCFYIAHIVLTLIAIAGVLTVLLALGLTFGIFTERHVTWGMVWLTIFDYIVGAILFFVPLFLGRALWGKYRKLKLSVD